MRMEVVTHTRMISLGVFAKDMFAKNVLTIDDDGSFDVLQTVKKDTLDRIRELPLHGGFTQRIKNGTIEAFSEMNVGEKFLCLNAWVTDYKGKEAQFYWKVQEYCNKGYNLKDAQAEARKSLEESSGQNIGL